MEFTPILMLIGICLILILILREVMVWYLKINTRLEEAKKQTKLLEEQSSLLKKMITLQLDHKKWRDGNNEPQKKPEE